MHEDKQQQTRDERQSSRLHDFNSTSSVPTSASISFPASLSGVAEIETQPISSVTSKNKAHPEDHHHIGNDIGNDKDHRKSIHTKNDSSTNASLPPSSSGGNDRLPPLSQLKSSSNTSTEVYTVFQPQHQSLSQSRKEETVVEKDHSITTSINLEIFHEETGKLMGPRYEPNQIVFFIFFFPPMFSCYMTFSLIYCTVLCCAVLCYAMLYPATLYRTILYDTILAAVVSEVFKKAQAPKCTCTSIRTKSLRSLLASKFGN